MLAVKVGFTFLLSHITNEFLANYRIGLLLIDKEKEIIENIFLRHKRFPWFTPLADAFKSVKSFFQSPSRCDFAYNYLSQ